MVNISVPPAIGVATALALGIPIVMLATAAWRRHVMHRYTALKDLALVGRPRPGERIKGTAVICGGSIAGLLTARVLSDHYESVVVIEPESFTFTEEARAVDLTEPPKRQVVDPVTGEPYTAIVHKRSRIWQYTAIHVFQVLMTRFLRAAFPTFDKRAHDAGIRFGRADYNLHIAGKVCNIPFSKYQGRDYELFFSTRRAFETMLRDLVVDTCGAKGMEGFTGGGNVEFIKGTVTGFNLDAKQKIIQSISCRDSEGKLQTLAADLVSDCTGNSQAGLKYLARALGRPALLSIRLEYNPKMFYQSMELPLPPNFVEEVTALNIIDPRTNEPLDIASQNFFLSWIPDPLKDNHTLLLQRLENNRIVFGTGGWDSTLFTSWDEAVDYARQTPGAPDWLVPVLEIIGREKDRMSIFQARVTSCSRVRYESVPDILPCNYVALGDSVMRLNPRLGEGCTKSAMSAITLDGVLRQRLPSDPKFSRTFFDLLACRSSPFWDASKWSDYGAPTTVPCDGESLNEGASFRAFTRKVHHAMAKNQVVGEAFWKNMMFLAPASDMASLNVVLSVLKEAWWPRST